MRRSGCCRTRARRRLLRPRGDAPSTRRPFPASAAAAPPARRCADVEAVVHPRLTGCSARAEIRRPRPRSSGRSAAARLLRPRGDAPESVRRCIHAGMAAPPARRCALRRRGEPDAGAGCSARAEMRPSRSFRSRWGPWLLRPRGDAPATHRFLARPRGAAPPARRCAAHADHVRHCDGGCSARAEMRPSRSPTRRPRRGLLRPRGDAPLADRGKTRDMMAAPPARRCAVDEVGRDVPHAGCSARAEMRPCAGSACRPAPWLLRPRGDAPRARTRRWSRNRAAPPARRCARGARDVAEIAKGCSARAEMRRTIAPP